MKHKMMVFSSKGDSVIAEWDVEEEKEVAHAKGMFDSAIADGFAAVTPAADDSGAVAVGDTFKPELEEIYLLRPIAGG